jgi:hypothetical protein
MARTFYTKNGIAFSDEITDNLVKLRGAVRQRVRDGVLLAAGLIQSKAYDNANVSAGVRGHAVDGSHMRDNIAVHLVETPTQVEARVGIDLSIVPYAPHQEFGPNGNSFMRRAIDESRDECHEIMQSIVVDGADARSFVRFNSGGKPAGVMSEE